MEKEESTQDVQYQLTQCRTDQGCRGRDGQDAEEQGYIFPSWCVASQAEDYYNKDSLGIAGQLKAKLAKLRKELLEPSGGGGGGGGQSHRNQHRVARNADIKSSGIRCGENWCR